MQNKGRTCSEPGCINPAWCRGRCVKHYFRRRRRALRLAALRADWDEAPRVAQDLGLRIISQAKGLLEYAAGGNK